MNLPSPYQTLANCAWLPRIIAKARLLNAASLPDEYAARFCHALKPIYAHVAASNPQTVFDALVIDEADA